MKKYIIFIVAVLLILVPIYNISAFDLNTDILFGVNGGVSINDSDTIFDETGIGGAGNAVIQCKFLDYLSAGIELGYFNYSFENNNITSSESNITSSELNLYIDPDDLVIKYGGIGTVSADYFSIPVYAVGYYKFDIIEDSFAIYPYGLLGFQLDILTSGSFDIKGFGEYSIKDFLAPFLASFNFGLGAGFELAFGTITLEFRYALGLNTQTGGSIYGVKDSDYPMHYDFPEMRFSSYQIRIGYVFSISNFTGD